MSVVNDFKNHDMKVSEVSQLSKKYAAGRLKKEDIVNNNGTINQVYNLE